METAKMTEDILPSISTSANPSKFNVYAEPILISYVRFSTMEQQKGNSLARQIGYAQKVAEEKGMKLDDSLTIKDLGLSAYHQTNITNGGLGLFLDAVREGKIPRGSILVIESLDRISRAEPLRAQGILTQIIDAGITVNTAIDQKEYDTETIKKNPMDLVFMILVMIRAHEESEIKSKRVVHALVHQCSRWLDGERGFRVKCGKAPKWLRWDDNIKSFVFIEREKNIMLRKVELYKQGFGGLRIAELLNEEFGKGTSHHTGANIYKEVRRRTLIGENNVSVAGEEFSLKGYYPSLLSISEFDSLVKDSKARGTTKHRQKFVGILSGIDIFKCELCGNSVGSHVIYRGKELNKVPSSHKRYGCVEARRNNGCCSRDTFQVTAIEKAVLTYCQDTVNLQRILNQTDNQQPLLDQISWLESKKNDNQANIDYLIEASMKTKSTSLAHKLHQLEAEVVSEDIQLRELHSQLRSINTASNNDLIKEWQTLTKNFDSMSNDERLKIRLLIKDTFKKITLGSKHAKKQNGVVGAIARAKNNLLRHSLDNYVDLTLVFHNDLVRVIRIDKFSGELIKGFDICDFIA